MCSSVHRPPGLRRSLTPTKAALKHAQDWLLAHAWRLMAYTALILGACLAVSGRPALAELTW